VKLFYFRHVSGVPNFGDELNPWIWMRLLPDAFNDDDRTQFVGIGTVLNDRLPVAPRTVVFGAGVGYYGSPCRDDTWSVYCVRGPLSARVLGLPAEAAVTDPAALIRRVCPRRSSSGASGRAFMPHWKSDPDEWRGACEETGLALIDPRWPPDRVLDALQQTDLLITEAMHGAIVADALRIPWIPVRTREAINSFKWEDWCRSVALTYQPHHLPAVWAATPGAGLVQRMRRRAKLTIVTRALVNLVKRTRPTLTREDVLEERLRELEDRLEQLRSREVLAPRFQRSSY